MPHWWRSGPDQPPPESPVGLHGLLRGATAGSTPGDSGSSQSAGSGDAALEERAAETAAASGEPPTAGADGAGPEQAEPWHRRARSSFRQWRQTRPFWAGLLCLLGGALMAYGPLSVFRYVLVAGTVIWAGVLMGLLVCAMGLFMWFTPQFRQLVGVFAAIFSVVSLITSNLGGFVIGMLLGSLGGAMGFAWTTLPAQSDQAGAKPATPAPPDEGAGRDQRDENDSGRLDPGAPARATVTAPLPRGAVTGR